MTFGFRNGRGGSEWYLRDYHQARRERWMAAVKFGVKVAAAIGTFYFVMYILLQYQIRG